MAISEQQRYELFQRLEERLGSEEASTMMDLLPPVGWADVATKHDLLPMGDQLDHLRQRMDRLEQRMDRLEQRMDRLDERLEATTKTYIRWMLSLHVTTLGIVGSWITLAT